jgi:DNA-binding LacI/PurR family transcriptional regulator
MANIKWEFIYQELYNRISGGNWADNKITMPTEENLAAQYHCSRPTVRKALAELRQAGYITSVKGAGVYINTFPKPETNARLFGIISPNLGPGGIFDTLCKQLTQCASLEGHSILWSGYVSPTSEMLKLDILQICERYIGQQIAGLFFSPFEYHEKEGLINQEILNVISRANIPIVLIDAHTRPYPGFDDFDLVSMNHTRAAYVLSKHIIDQGFRKIFFLAPPHSHHTIKLRLMGYHEALIDHDLRPEPLVDFSENGMAAFGSFIKTKKPEAIICSNDITAMKLINAIEKLGLNVPGDIAIAGFDNLSQAMLFTRLITSIEQPLREICGAAMNLMTARLANPHRVVSEILLPGRLVIGDTTVPGKS